MIMRSFLCNEGKGVFSPFQKNMRSISGLVSLKDGPRWAEGIKQALRVCIYSMCIPEHPGLCTS